MTEKELRKIVREEVEKIQEAKNLDVWKTEDLDVDLGFIKSYSNHIKSGVDDFKLKMKDNMPDKAINYLEFANSAMKQLIKLLMNSTKRFEKELVVQKKLIKK